MDTERGTQLLARCGPPLAVAVTLVGLVALAGAPLCSSGDATPCSCTATSCACPPAAPNCQASCDEPCSLSCPINASCTLSSTASDAGTYCYGSMNCQVQFAHRSTAVCDALCSVSGNDDLTAICNDYCSLTLGARASVECNLSAACQGSVGVDSTVTCQSSNNCGFSVGARSTVTCAVGGNCSTTCLDTCRVRCQSAQCSVSCPAALGAAQNCSSGWFSCGSCDGGASALDAGLPSIDAGPGTTDAGRADAGLPSIDAGPGTTDAGRADAGLPSVDGGPGTTDAGRADAGLPSVDAGPGTTDAGSADAGLPSADAGSDAGAAAGDAGAVDGGEGTDGGVTAAVPLRSGLDPPVATAVQGARLELWITTAGLEGWTLRLFPEGLEPAEKERWSAGVPLGKGDVFRVPVTVATSAGEARVTVEARGPAGQAQAVEVRLRVSPPHLELAGCQCHTGASPGWWLAVLALAAWRRSSRR